MFLETLKNVKQLGGFKVRHCEHVRCDSQLRNDFIMVDHYESLISFKIQDGEIKKNGVNGCQVYSIIELSKKIIEGLNKKLPCRENSIVVTKLEEALMWLEKRKRNMIKGINNEEENL